MSEELSDKMPERMPYKMLNGMRDKHAFCGHDTHTLYSSKSGTNSCACYHVEL